MSFRLHKPTPRTAEQRAARRDEYERYKGKLLAPVDPDCIEAISVARPELVPAGEQVLRALANVYRFAAMPARRHRRHKDCFWLHNQELEGAFGRGKFKAFARRHRIATVVHERSHGWTEAWKLDADFEQRVVAELAARNRTPLPAIGVGLPDAINSGTVASSSSDSLPPQIEPPKARTWTASRNLQGLSRSLVGEATLTPVVPVDMDALFRLDDIFAELERTPLDERLRRLAALKMDPDVDLLRRRRVLGVITSDAKSDPAGYGRITHEYVMKSTGRLFAEGRGLQRAPRIIKRFALNGAFVFDFENCHFSIIQQLAAREGRDCPAVSHYLANKHEVRQEIADWAQISITQAKECLIGVGYGAATVNREGVTIPDAIGQLAAGRLFMNPTFSALQKELEEIRPLLLKPYTRRKGKGVVLKNALGLRFDEEAKRAEKGKIGPKKQAHVLQGIEAQALLAVLRAYPNDILLLEHDGFVSREPIPLDVVERLVLEETGFRLKASCEVNSLPEEPETSCHRQHKSIL
jgi:hypothetical protein